MAMPAPAQGRPWDGGDIDPMRALVLYRFLPQYRVAFYERLRERLAPGHSAPEERCGAPVGPVAHAS